MKHIIYHRAPTFEDGKVTADRLEWMLEHWFKPPSPLKPEIIVEEADDLAKQLKLANLIDKLKLDKLPRNETHIYCYDFNSLCSAGFMVAIRQLEEIQQLALVSFYNQSDKYLGSVTSFIMGYIGQYQEERGRLLAHRIAKNGRSYGRPSIDIDVDRAIKLKAEGLSYKQIAEKLGQSASLIYSKLPKEVRQLYRSTNERFARAERTRIKRAERREKEKGEGGNVN